MRAMGATFCNEMSSQWTSPWQALAQTSPDLSVGKALSAIHGPLLFPLSEAWSCDGSTEACTNHLEEIRLQALQPPNTAPQGSLPQYVSSVTGSIPYEDDSRLTTGTFQGGSSGDTKNFQHSVESIHQQLSSLPPSFGSTCFSASR